MYGYISDADTLLLNVYLPNCDAKCSPVSHYWDRIYTNVFICKYTLLQKLSATLIYYMNIFCDCCKKCRYTLIKYVSRRRSIKSCSIKTALQLVSYLITQMCLQVEVVEFFL